MIKSADLVDKLIMYFIEHGMQVLMGIGIFVAGLFCAQWVGKVANRWFEKHKLEPQINQLLTQLVRLVVLAFFAIMALGQMGVQITPLIAGLGVAGVGARCVGLITITACQTGTRCQQQGQGKR